MVQGVHHRRVSDGDPRPEALNQVWGVGHGFLTCRHDKIGFTGPNHPGRVDHGGQTGEAEFVDRHGGHVPTDTSGQARLPCRALTCAGLDDLPYDDCFDMLGGDAGAFQRGADGVRAQLAGGEGGEAASETAERGAGAAEDYGNMSVCGHYVTFEWGLTVGWNGICAPCSVSRSGER